MSLKLPAVLLQHELRWEHSDVLVYRIVATKTEFGFEGVNYCVERRSNVPDALGVYPWNPLTSSETSLAIAAIGQYLLTQSKA